MHMILALSTVVGLDIWSYDLRQAYPPAGCALQPKHVTRPDVFELAPNKLMEILFPRYGIRESGTTSMRGLPVTISVANACNNPPVTFRCFQKDRRPDSRPVRILC